MKEQNKVGFQSLQNEKSSISIVPNTRNPRSTKLNDLTKDTTYLMVKPNKNPNLLQQPEKILK